MNEVSKNEIRNRIEYIMSYLLSKKYDAEVKIHLKKEEITSVNVNTSGDIVEE